MTQPYISYKHSYFILEAVDSMAMIEVISVKEVIWVFSIFAVKIRTENGLKWFSNQFW